MFKLLRILLPMLLMQTLPPVVPPVAVPPKVDPPEPPDVKFDDAQQKRLNDLIAAERKSTEDRVKAALKAEAETEKQRLATEAQRKKDEDSGAFEAVKQSLTVERDGIATERDTLKQDNESLLTYFTADYTAALKDLPDVIKAFAPADTASVADKSTWLTKAKVEAAKIEKKPIVRGSGFGPKPIEGESLDIEKETAKVRSRYRT